MSNLLYLVHRLPFPPDKGDKVRSFHLLEHLAARHRVFLGTFIDDPRDEAHVASVRARCADLHVARLSPAKARLRSLGSLVGSRPLTLAYYRDAGLARWVDEIIARHRIDAAVIYSSAMAQYVENRAGLSLLVDFVDVDSAKWVSYGNAHRWPLSWVYRREGDRLLAYERTVAKRAQRSFFVTEGEAALFRRLAPECAGSVEAMVNGVDAHYFCPDPARGSPYEAGEIPLVFTGAMDYWPNVDAVRWFVAEVLPNLRAKWPTLRLHIVGRNPTAEVRALAAADIVVTGTVPDVRPYLQYAAVAVAPLRIARGIQNKILEAMAMACPVVASRECAQAIDAATSGELLAAADAQEFDRAVSDLLGDPEWARRIGRAGRRRVQESYAWTANLSRIDAHLEALQPEEMTA